MPPPEAESLDVRWSAETVSDEIELPVPLGATLAGRYRLDAVIGRGGMGVVVSATDETSAQRFAIKFLAADRTRKHERERLMREARIAARLKSHHAVRVFEIGVTADDTPYVAMELLGGRDLRAELAARGPLQIDEAVIYVCEALGALSEAHRLGVIHRDIKLANLFLVDEPGGRRSIRVLDFGISKILDGSSDSMRADGVDTATGAFLGSPGYMSPEQVRSAKDVDHRADIWAIGVVLYELLTAERAFTGGSAWDVMKSVCERDLPSIRKTRPDVPVELARVVQRCLSRDPSARFATADDLVGALVPFTRKMPRSRWRGEAPRRVLYAVAVAAALCMAAVVAGRLRGDGSRAAAAGPDIDPHTAAATLAPAVTAVGEPLSAASSATEEDLAATAVAPSSHPVPRPRERPRPHAPRVDQPITRSPLLKTRE